MTIIEAMRTAAKRHGVSEGDVLGHTRKPHIVKSALGRLGQGC